MPETTPLIKAALNLRVGAGFDVYDFSVESNQKFSKSDTYRKSLTPLISSVTFQSH